jgi:hypothetical protein
VDFAHFARNLKKQRHTFSTDAVVGFMHYLSFLKVETDEND